MADHKEAEKLINIDLSELVPVKASLTKAKKDAQAELDAIKSKLDLVNARIDSLEKSLVKLRSKVSVNE